GFLVLHLLAGRRHRRGDGRRAGGRRRWYGAGGGPGLGSPGRSTPAAAGRLGTGRRFMVAGGSGGAARGAGPAGGPGRGRRSVGHVRHRRADRPHRRPGGARAPLRRRAGPGRRAVGLAALAAGSKGRGGPCLARLGPDRQPAHRRRPADRLEPRPQDRLRPRLRPLGGSRRRRRPPPGRARPDLARRHGLRRGRRRDGPSGPLLGAARHDRRLRGPGRRRRRPPGPVRQCPRNHPGREGRHRRAHRRPHGRPLQPPPSRRLVAARRSVEHRRRLAGVPVPTGPDGRPRQPGRGPRPGRHGLLSAVGYRRAVPVRRPRGRGALDRRSGRRGGQVPRRARGGGLRRTPGPGAARRARRRPGRPPPSGGGGQPQRRVVGHPGHGARPADRPAGVGGNRVRRLCPGRGWDAAREPAGGNRCHGGDARPPDSAGHRGARPAGEELPAVREGPRGAGVVAVAGM
ncbi:MAG: carbohydrate kinase, FGGY(), partial [uncultured Acidimicrobiales bacterium]